MFVSTIIPTISRPVLDRAVNSVLGQEFNGEFEVIVVNDSGKPLPDAAWQRSPRVTVINNQRRERIFARNSGAAAARGKYLHFLDDDDWLLPGALQSLWDLAQGSNAHWLYGSSQLVDRKGRPIIQLHHRLNGNCFVQVMAGEWIPLQSSFIQAEAFFKMGGFTPLVFASQDVDLCRRIALRGEIAGIPQVVACIGMGSEGSSTDTARHAQYSRWAREKILSEPGVFARLHGSATSSNWQGRVVRMYLTSAAWNLQHRKGFTALSRMVFGLGSLALAGRHLVSLSFWRAIGSRYISPTFIQGFETAPGRLESSF